MNAAKIVLLTVIAVLLLILMIDASQRAKQLQAVHEAIRTGVRVTQTAEVQTLPGQPQTGVASEITDPKDRDGKARLGVNFLLPANRSHYHPDWIRGTLKEFETLPVSLNPLVSNLASAGAARGLTNDSLCDHHPASPELWSEALATSVRILDNYKLYVFTIRPGIYWQRPTIAGADGFAWLEKRVELTAEDFAFNLDLINNPDVKCGHLKQYYGNARGFALDRYTFLVRWDVREYSNISSSLGLSPLPKHIYGSNADGTPIPDHLLGVTMNKHWFDEQHQMIGVGSYRLDAFIPDKSISFVRDQAYWGAGTHFERIEWDDSVKDPPAKLVAFKNGQVHVHGLSPDEYKAEILDAKEPRFSKPDKDNPRRGITGEFAWQRFYANSFAGMAWNCARPQLRDVKVRKALAYAFPKDRVFQDVFVGLGRPQIGPVHPDSPSFNRDLKEFTFDLDTARALLKEAGWEDSDSDGWLDRTIDGKSVPLHLDAIYFVHSITWATMLQIYRESLRQIGVDLEPHGVDGPEWERRSDERDFDGFIIGWNSGDLEEDYKQVWHSSSMADQGSNYANWSNPEADKLIEAHRNEFDFDKRLEISRQFQAVCFEDQPYLFIRSGEGILVWQNQPAPNKGVDALTGVDYGFEHFHPLYGRQRLYWHLVIP